MRPDIRVGVHGQGVDERFLVFEFPPHGCAEGGTVDVSDPMTEAEFRTLLADAGMDADVIEETIAGARAARNAEG